MTWKLTPKTKVKKLLSNDLPEKVIDELFKNKFFLINTDKTKKLVMTNRSTYNVFNEVKTKGIQPLFIGNGVLDTQDFKKARLNLSFATKASIFEVPKVYIKPKAEQLFLYGRDVWSDSIIKIEGKIKRREIVFMFNQDNLFIGLAFAMSDELTDKGRVVVLKNVIDTGYYLRIEK